MKNPSVAIILVNWKSYQFTQTCLRSLEQVHYQNKQIIVVDNESTAPDLESLKTAHPKVSYLAFNDNFGFTGGNNKGIEHAINMGCECIMLLNNDTEVEPDFIDHLIGEFLSDSAIGAVQPKINFVHDRNLVWNAGGKFSRVTGFTYSVGYKQRDNGDFDDPGTTDWITGCCILVRTAVVHQVGVLDDRYFAYFEDVDWSLRIRKAGFKLQYQPKSKIYHVAGASGKSKKKGKEGYQSPLVHYYNLRNHLYLIRSHVPGLFFPVAVLFQLVKLGAYCTFFLLMGRWQKLAFSLKGFKEGLLLK